MARETVIAAPTGEVAPPALKGLLITANAALVRAFRRELRSCGDCSISFDVRSSLEEARRAAGKPYDCVTVDLDGGTAPSDAVRLVRRSWPHARVAVLSGWWSERDAVAWGQADVVIHKPLRAPELRAFLRSPTGAPREETLRAPAKESVAAAATR